MKENIDRALDELRRNRFLRIVASGALALTTLFSTTVAPARMASSLAPVAAATAAVVTAPATVSAAVTTTVAAVSAAVASSSAKWSLPNLDNARVDKWTARFTSDLKDDFELYMKRMSNFDDMILQKLAANQMPSDLIFLAMIESGFNPKAVSPAKASGLWQFVSETAQRYGLTVKGKVDERKDPVKETDAALAYLSDLYDRFGSWYLAAAAYNTGENRVARLMVAATGSEHGTDNDYYRISGKLPQETQDYIPKMIAAARIAKDPEKYGFGDLASAFDAASGAPSSTSATA